jgi:alkyl sulfatase BDS1-like metallo-beta-lactamase superfamily hydrolase
MGGLSSDILFDAMAIRLNPAKAAGQSMVINWHFTDRAEKLAVTLKHCTLSHRLGDWSDKAACSITTTRAVLDSVILGKLQMPAAIADGLIKFEGDPSRVGVLFTLLDEPGGLMFDILTPGEGR